ncbi:SRPBCC family protein [Austwickia chelonae]|uniref:SRPBCC family protein n=1 Tax=Austwickia chelonae TaxID=100225 RepID=UPI000E24D5E8|nr:SRPBCC family protein [Austwickia chelonae]
MADVRLETHSTLTPIEAWNALWDLRAHDQIIPLTRVRGRALAAPHECAQALDVGARFVARTGWGPFVLDDPMEILRWEPPVVDPDGRSSTGLAVIVKRGRWVRGRIEATVSPHETGPYGSGSTVTWVQTLAVAGMPRCADPMTGAVGRAAYGAVLRRLLERRSTAGSAMPGH